jgi:hypothetical protein
MIKTTASVSADHRLVVDTDAPAEIAPGEHPVVVLVEPPAKPQAAGEPLFQPHEIGPVSDEITFSREQIYGDDGDDGR